MKFTRTPRQVDPERFKSHELWLMSNKGMGERMVLSGDYRGANLAGADLREARIKANLRGANLSGVKLNGADLEGAILWDADLVNADLTDATGLLPTERTHGFYPLSGADLQGAKLPDNIGEFPALAKVIELCKSAGALFLSLVVGDAVIQLTALKTTDLQLVSNNGMSSIPIFNTDAPTSTVFWFGPAVLLVSYLALLFYMQKLWELIASLPAVFPDGLLFNQKAYPWMATGMIGSYFPRLKDRPQSLPVMERFLYTGLMYFLIPLSFVPMFCRYLAAHDWRGTSVQIGIIWICTFYWWVFVCLARAVLSRNSSFLNGIRGPLTIETLRPKFRMFLSASAAATSCGGIAMLVACNGPFQGERPLNRTLRYNRPSWSLRRIVPNILSFCDLSPFVNLQEKELSKRPQNWAESPHLEYVTSKADLKNRDLRFGNLQNAFVVNGDLQGAMLVHSNLNGADLRGANLSGVNCSCASFTRTRLALADMSNANLEAAQISQADMAGANLSSANLAHARFSRVSLEGAVLRGANFKNADISDTDFADAHLEGNATRRSDPVSQQEFSTYASGADFSNLNLAGSNFERAHLEGADFKHAGLFGADLSHSNLDCAILRSANLREANMHGANLEHADLQHADLRFANLSSACFTNSDLSLTNMRYCILRGADLRGANLAGAVFTNASMTGARYDRNTHFPALFKPSSHGMVMMNQTDNQRASTTARRK